MELELQKEKMDQERNEKEREAEEWKHWEHWVNLEFQECKLMLQLLQKLVDKNICWFYMHFVYTVTLQIIHMTF